MKKIALMMGLLLGSSSVWAAPQSKPLSFFINGGVQQYSYTEFAPQDEGGGKLMNISGMLWGVSAGANLQQSLQYTTIEQMIKFAYFGGLDTKYDGRIQDGAAYSAPSNDYYFFTEYHLMPHIIHNDFFVLKADLGIGHRFLHNEVETSYRRSQHYLYFSSGLDGEVFVSPRTSIFSKIHYLGLLQGWHKTYLTDVGYDRDLNFTQDFGYGYRVELGLKRLLINSLAVELSAYYEFWNIGASNFLTASKAGQKPTPFFEPHNHTHTYGVQVGIRF